jgi:ribosomal protein S24E
MKLDIVKEVENKLLHRKEIDAVLTDISTTPSKKDVTASLAANLGVSENAMVLGSIYQEYGKKVAT